MDRRVCLFITNSSDWGRVEGHLNTLAQFGFIPNDT